jgi:hypothetical protein
VRTASFKLLMGMMVVYSSISLFAGTEAAKPPFSISISAVKPHVKAGSEVFIKIVLTNLSDHEINCSSGFANGVDRSYRYIIQDGRGKTIKKFENKHPEIDTATSVELCSLKPGESANSESRVGHDYDLRHPDQYSIQVSRPISNNTAEGVVYSNKITLTIVE